MRSAGMQRGFTLIELLVVIGIIAMLSAILFPVFGRAREKARQTACLNNQRQVVTAILIYAEDNDELFPASSAVWQTMSSSPKSLVCPSYKSGINGYVYNNALSAAPVGAITSPDQTLVTGDGTHAASTSPQTFANVAYAFADYDFRHANMIVAAYADGHAALTKQVGASGPSLWLAADSQVMVNYPKVTSWTGAGSSISMNGDTTTPPTIDYTYMNSGGINYSSIRFPQRASWGQVFCSSTTIPSTGILDFTVMAVFQLDAASTAVTTSTAYLWDMTNQGSSWCATQDGLTVSYSGALSAYLNGSAVLSTAAMSSSAQALRHLVVMQASVTNGTTLCLDGTQVAADVTKKPNANRATGAWTIQLGNGYGTNSIYLAELLYYPQALAAQDLAAMTTTLKAKYGM